eukprot:s76_g38.t1
MGKPQKDHLARHPSAWLSICMATMAHTTVSLVSLDVVDVGITLQCKQGEKPELVATADPIVQCLSSGHVSNQKPDEKLLEDPLPEPPVNFMDDKPLRCSYESWTQYKAQDPASSPNRKDHEEWTRAMEDLKTFFEDAQNRTQLRKYVAKLRGEDESMFGWIWNGRH